MVDSSRRYVSQGYKRQNIFDRICKALGDLTIHLQKFSPIKWITSDFKIMRKFLEAYLNLALTLRAISENQVEANEIPFDASTRAQARELYGQMIQINNLIWTAAITDLLFPISYLNLRLQRNDYTVVDALSMVDDCLNKLRQISTDPRPSSNTPNLGLLLLSTVSTSTNNVAMNLDHLLSGQRWKFYGIRNKPSEYGEYIEMNHSEEHSFTWSQYQDLVKHLILKLEERLISKENIRQLYIFRNDLLPFNPPIDRNAIDDIRNYLFEYVDRYSNPAFASEFYQGSDLVIQLADLYQKLSTHEKFSELKMSSPMIFWTTFMDLYPEAFSPQLKRMILSVLSVPVSNAQCERTISLISHAQKKHTMTSLRTIQTILNLKSNGPPVREFDAIRFAKAWHEAGNHLSDEPPRAVAAPAEGGQQCSQETEDGLDIDGEFIAGAVGGSDVNLEDEEEYDSFVHDEL